MLCNWPYVRHFPSFIVLSLVDAIIWNKLKFSLRTKSILLLKDCFCDTNTFNLYLGLFMLYAVTCLVLNIAIIALNSLYFRNIDQWKLKFNDFQSQQNLSYIKV